MTAYTPSCPACRDSDPENFYKSCGGCQARRALAMKTYHQKPGAKLPAPSTNKPAGVS
jgi:hypothetical protein